MKHLKVCLVLAVLAGMAIYAPAWVDTFSVSRIDDVNYGNHSRLYFNITYDGYYPFLGQAAIRVYWARDHAIGNELPPFDQSSLPPAVQVPAGHRVAMATVGTGQITYECRAKKDMASEFEWVFAEDAPVVPTEWVASVPWAVCNDLWQTSIALHNPTDQPVTATLAFYSATGQQVAPGGMLFIERYIPPYGISAFYIDDFFPPGAVFAGSILMSADAPLDYLYLTTDGTGYLTYCTKFE